MKKSTDTLTTEPGDKRRVLGYAVISHVHLVIQVLHSYSFQSTLDLVPFSNVTPSC